MATPVSSMDTDLAPSASKRPNVNVRRPRGSRGRGSGRGKPNDRTVEWRQRTNTRVNDQLQAERDARFASFAMPDAATAAKQLADLPIPSSSIELTAVQNLGLAVTRYAQPIPIATQSIGFIVNQYYLKLTEQLGFNNVTERCTIHQLYRYSLAQLSYHLYRHVKETIPRYSYRVELPPPPVLTFDIVEALKACELNIGLITGYIQRIGCITAHDVPHVPVLMTEDVLSPFYVNIFTLRATLDALNNAAPEFVEHFIQHNSIPGIRVAANRITNAEQVIPRDYASADLYRDASAVRALMNYTASKMRDVQLFTGRLGNLCEGNPGMLLVSRTLGEEVRIPPSSRDVLIPPIVGSINTFHSHVNHTDDQRRLGVIGLYVREDTSEVHYPRGNEWLNGSTAHYVVSADYSAYINRLIG